MSISQILRERKRERERDREVKSNILSFGKVLTAPSPIAQSVALRIENRRSLVRSTARPIFFPRIDDSHCDRIHSSLTCVCCLDKGYVRKQPVARNEYWAEYWLKELPESVNRCSGRYDITALYTIQLIYQLYFSQIAFPHDHH